MVLGTCGATGQGDRAGRSQHSSQNMPNAQPARVVSCHRVLLQVTLVVGMVWNLLTTPMAAHVMTVVYVRFFGLVSPNTAG